MNFLFIIQEMFLWPKVKEKPPESQQGLKQNDK